MQFNELACSSFVCLSSLQEFRSACLDLVRTKHVMLHFFWFYSKPSLGIMMTVVVDVVVVVIAVCCCCCPESYVTKADTM